MTVKRILSLFLVLVVLLSLFGCTPNVNEPGDPTESESGSESGGGSESGSESGGDSLRVNEKLRELLAESANRKITLHAESFFESPYFDSIFNVSVSLENDTAFVENTPYDEAIWKKNTQIQLSQELLSGLERFEQQNDGDSYALLMKVLNAIASVTEYYEICDTERSNVYGLVSLENTVYVIRFHGGYATRISYYEYK